MPGILVKIQSDGTVENIPVKEKSPPLGLLQVHVGGYIEGIKVMYEGKTRTAYVNDEGLLRGLPINRLATEAAQAYYQRPISPIVGTMVIWMPNVQTSVSTT
jgi:hypothetical protein